MHTYWYKEAVIYSMDLRSFKDSNGDGIGDFRGLIENFDYLVDLGIDCIWLLPFFASEGKDFGYDVKGYKEIDPKLGTLEDFKELIALARSHGIKILLDLVVNHTSIKHPWFQEARKDKNSPYYDYYIWAEGRPKNHAQDVMFEGVEDSNWKFDEEAQEYYYHTFYHFQADLNITNPEVQREIREIIEFWMQLGIAGFRMDAVPHLVRKKGVDRPLKNSFEVLDSFKKIVTSHHPDGALVGEADVEPEEYLKYFKGRRLDGIFNFYCNNFLFYSLAVEDPDELIKAFERLPDTHESECYLNFIRNHDELDLSRLSDEQREIVYRTYGPDPDMRVYNRGIRRRLPPMVGNDQRIIELCYSLLLSLPGTPVLRYGQEIGMGDDLSLKERNSVRTAMQWNAGKNAGFSSSDNDESLWPLIREGEFGYKHINVEAQQQDKSSLLNVVKSLIRARKFLIEFSHGPFKSIRAGHRSVMVHYCPFNNRMAMAIHNFCNATLTTEAELPAAISDMEFSEIIRRRAEAEIKNGKIYLKMEAYGFIWFGSSGI